MKHLNLFMKLLLLVILMGFYSCREDEIFPVQSGNGITGPTQASPESGTVLRRSSVTFAWSRIGIENGYILQISTDSNFSSVTYEKSGLTDTINQLDNLEDNRYFWRVNAVLPTRLLLETTRWSSIWEFTVLTTSCPGVPTVRYANNRTYHTVLIGGRCWLKENIDYGVRIDGTQEQTNNGTIEKYCYNNDTNNCNTYGGLYQWDEAMQYATAEGARGICPRGWHIPTEEEFRSLSRTVRNYGNALKEIGEGTGIGAGTNTSGFSALLSGYRYHDGSYYDLGKVTNFWSSPEYSSYYASTMDMYDYNSAIYLHLSYKRDGFSVRCVMD